MLRPLTAAAVALCLAASVQAGPREAFDQALKSADFPVAPATLNHTADLAQGEQLATTRCMACHGKAMLKAMAAYPSIQGQKPTYLFKQLVLFKSGQRNNPIMQGQAMGLTETQMKDLAFYLSQQPAQDLR